MDPSTLVSMAQKSLGDRGWNVENVLRIGAELLSFVKAFPNLSSQGKIDLVCQTILKMLDDAEKAERVLKAESTGKETTIYYLEECKKTVLTVLPVTLELMSLAHTSAATLQKCLPSQWPSWGSWGTWGPLSSCFSVKAVHDTVTAVEDALKHPQEYLEEMRDLVSKVEKLFSEASALKASALNEASALKASALNQTSVLNQASALKDGISKAEVSVLSFLQKAELSHLPSNNEPPAVSLPGESVNHSEVELSQQ